ncbi:retrovirus-related pol polyprotein from transposon TNT 1-94 [Tanacetum coccineum]
MLGKKPNKVYDPFLKAGLGYQNPERLKKAIAAQPKLYNGDSLHKFSTKQTYFSIPSTSNNGSESKEVTSELPILKMPKESRLLNMFDTMVVEINGLQTRIGKTLLEDRERRWMSDSQNSLREFYKTDVISMSKALYKTLKEIKEELIKEVQEMLNIFESMEKQVAEKSPKETILENEIDRLLEVSLTSEIQDCVLLYVEKQKNKLLEDELDKSSNDSKDIQANLLKRIKILENDFKRSQAQKVDELIENVNQKTYAYADVHAQNQDLLMTIYELKNKLQTIEKGKNVNTKFDKSETLEKLVCVTSFNKTLANKAKNVSNTKVPLDRSKPVTSHSTPKTEQSGRNNENVIARGMHNIIKQETKSPDSKANIHVSNSTGAESSNSVRRPKSKDTKSKNRVLKNTKSSSTYVWKTSSSDSIDSNKCEQKDSNVCQTNACVSNSKTLNAYVNVVNDGLNIVCISCGKDVFLHSHEKCVSHYALSRISSVKRALFHSPVAAKSKNLGATSIVAKSRLSVVKTPTTTNKVSSASPLSQDSSQSRILSNYMNKKIATSRKWQKWFEYKQGFNWSPKIKTAQSQSCEKKSKTSDRTKSKTPVTTQKWIVDSGCSKHMIGNLQLLRNFVEKFIGTVRFGNDHFAAITGYGDYVQGNITICHVYYVEGLGHNLFSVGQFCDGDLEVAFRSNTCYVRNLKGDDMLTGSRDSNLYTISIFEMAASSLVCLMSRATSTKSWLWHRQLSHLNFGTINQLTSNDLVDGLPKYKYNKDHLCSACEQGKSKKASLPLKLVPSTESKLKLLRMDLCRPMRVASINGKKYILVIVDDYSWNLKAQILTIRTDNGTEFKNEKLRTFYAKLGIVHKTSIARTPQQNGVVERRNQTLIEAARTMLIFSIAPEFLWAEAIATACFTKNRSIVHTRHNKTPYELIQGKKPNVQYFHVFGSGF